VKPGAASLHEGVVVPVLQTISQALEIDPVPHFTVVEPGDGGLHDGKLRGNPCVLFADVHARNAGTSGTLNGEALIGCSCDAVAEPANIPHTSSEPSNERSRVLFFIIHSPFTGDQPVGNGRSRRTVCNAPPCHKGRKHTFDEIF
jgi:hypothetical protein